jgi:hypothetical protein
VADHPFDPVAFVFGGLALAAGIVVLAGGSLTDEARVLLPAGLITLGLAMFVKLARREPAPAPVPVPMPPAVPVPAGDETAAWAAVDDTVAQTAGWAADDETTDLARAGATGATPDDTADLASEDTDDLAVDDTTGPAVDDTVADDEQPPGAT